MESGRQILSDFAVFKSGTKEKLNILNKNDVWIIVNYKITFQFSLLVQGHYSGSNVLPLPLYCINLGSLTKTLL